MTGVLTFALSIVLGITSLPSVTSSMTWKEFAFVQSKLGWIALLLACAHDMFYGWPYMDSPSCKIFGSQKIIPSSFQVRIRIRAFSVSWLITYRQPFYCFQYCLYFPGLAILLKIPLILPGISHHLDKIRGGYERKRVSKQTKKRLPTTGRDNKVVDKI